MYNLYKTVLLKDNIGAFESRKIKDEREDKTQITKAIRNNE